MTDGSNSGDRGSRRQLLVVEDESAIRKAVHRAFRQDYDVHEASDGNEGLERALAIKPSVVISDQRMPGMTGVELLSRVKEELPKAVRILITGYDDYRAIVGAVNAADVHHYFEKPFHPHDLHKVVDTLVRNAELEAQRDHLLEKLRRSVAKLEQSNQQLLESEARLTHEVEARTAQLKKSYDEVRAANARLRDMAVRDGLTGLFNHRYLVEALNLEVARSARYGRTFCLLFIDIDDFKRVNDSYGHRIGDAVLQKVAELLGTGPSGLRHSDLAARYGGEEFCIVLPETPHEGGEHKAELLRRDVEAISWTNEELPEGFRLTISVGMACFPGTCTDADQLLRNADKALYQAKRAGKNRVVACEPTGDTDTVACKATDGGVV